MAATLLNSPRANAQNMGLSRHKPQNSTPQRLSAELLSPALVHAVRQRVTPAAHPRQ
jgi:hypothetical protein